MFKKPRNSVVHDKAAIVEAPHKVDRLLFYITSVNSKLRYDLIAVRLGESIALVKCKTNRVTQHTGGWTKLPGHIGPESAIVLQFSQ